MTRTRWISISAAALLLGGVSSAAIAWAFLAHSPSETARDLQEDKALQQSRLDNARSNRPGPSASQDAEGLEIDVSARTIPVTSSFTGTEIIVFGTVRNSRQEYAAAGHYDIAIVVEGEMTPVIVRKKSNVGGIWINTSAVRFASLPAYYAVVSTKPLREIATSELLASEEIGFSNIPMNLAGGNTKGLSESEIADYKQAIVRLKTSTGLYQLREEGVAFIGRSLFRSTIQLPANIPVGAVKTHVHLFHDGQLLASQDARVVLQREGVERMMHTFANRYPLFYGIFAVLLALSAGLLASRLFQRKS